MSAFSDRLAVLYALTPVAELHRRLFDAELQAAFYKSVADTWQAAAWGVVPHAHYWHNRYIEAMKLVASAGSNAEQSWQLVSAALKRGDAQVAATNTKAVAALNSLRQQHTLQCILHRRRYDSDGCVCHARAINEQIDNLVNTFDGAS